MTAIDRSKPLRIVRYPRITPVVVADSETPVLDPGTGSLLIRWSWHFGSQHGNLIATLHTDMAPSSASSLSRTCGKSPRTRWCCTVAPTTTAGTSTATCRSRACWASRTRAPGHEVKLVTV